MKKKDSEKKPKRKKEKPPKKEREKTYDKITASMVAETEKMDEEVLDHWYLDPARKALIRYLVRAADDVTKIRLPAEGRDLSPTDTNPVQILEEDKGFLLKIGGSCRAFRSDIERHLEKLVLQAPGGVWLLSQKGIGPWLAGYLIAEFPDIYDAAICNDCGRYLLRDKDMHYWHASPPTKKDSTAGKKACKHDGKYVDAENYHMHERKPSTFLKFAGLDTVEGFKCPHCNYLLRPQYATGVPIPVGYIHPAYLNLPDGIQKCSATAKKVTLTEEGLPLVDGRPAIECRTGRKRVPGLLNTYHSDLRAKLLKVVAESFIRVQVSDNEGGKISGNPTYRPIYDGYKHRIACRDSYKSKMWVEMMARRAMIHQFIIDFFVVSRKGEGLPCRLPYAEEKLGIKHHP